MKNFMHALKEWWKKRRLAKAELRQEKRIQRRSFWRNLVRRFTVRKMIMAIITYLYLLLCVAIVIVPIMWLVSAAFTNVGAIIFNADGSVTYNLTNQNALTEVVDTYLGAQRSIGEYGLFPFVPDLSKFSLNTYQFLLTYDAEPSFDFFKAFFRTLGVATLNTILVVTFSSLTGFAFSRYRFKGKKGALLTLLTLQMFPAFMGMIAILGIFETFGWRDNWVALTFIYVAGAIPYNTFIVRGYMRNVSKSLDEAAAIDGASNLQILVKVIVPLAVPIMGFIAVNAFMSPWLDYILPSIIMNGKPTVGVILYKYIGGTVSSLVNNPVVFMAGALLIAVPIMLVQIYMQKYIVFGLTTGGEKG